MTVVGRANWWCSTCGAWGSGDGAAYDAWLRSHACGLSASKAPTKKPDVWRVPTSEPQTRTVPGRMTFTVLEKR